MFMISSDNKTRILSVVNIFETGTAEGVYGNVSIYHDGKKDENGQNTRQITYGRSQTTEQGNLKDLIAAYIANKGIFAADFQPYMPQLGVKPLVDDQNFINLLKKSAKDDPIMIKTQDDFFELGGDSLKAMVIMRLVSKKFDLEISFKEFLEAKNISGISKLSGQVHCFNKESSIQACQTFSIGASKSRSITSLISSFIFPPLVMFLIYRTAHSIIFRIV